ncbi:hypothetical protein HYC85_029679 [Camellia sinensis]|uniref:CCHC-type domain-containing protein n=1 Tax=Camellia sinensis TaxID=4442 RepID=A0A7J7G161_CAMSI|nr:hypothetical protein HYC85_029679 [Camellia sinensis]
MKSQLKSQPREGEKWTESSECGKNTRIKVKSRETNPEWWKSRKRHRKQVLFDLKCSKREGIRESNDETGSKTKENGGSKARYCMYGSFEAGTTRRTAQLKTVACYSSLQLSLYDHKLCSALCIVLAFCPCLRAHTFVCSLYALSKSSALSKMGRLWALTFTPIIVMTFEFCQRGATVDTPFLTVLKTWTSSFEHSVIIHVRVHFEISKNSAARLALGSLDLTVLCLVVDQEFVVLAPEAKTGFYRNKWPAGHFQCRPTIRVQPVTQFMVDDHIYMVGGSFHWPVAFQNDQGMVQRNTLGKLHKMDIHTVNGDRGRFARLCIQIELAKPLIAKITVGSSLVKVAYEGLSSVCFHCGLIGHRVGECQNTANKNTPVANQANTPPADGEPFGPWMLVQKRSKSSKKPEPASHSNVQPQKVWVKKTEIQILVPNGQPQPLTSLTPSSATLIVDSDPTVPGVSLSNPFACLSDSPATSLHPPSISNTDLGPCPLLNPSPDIPQSANNFSDPEKTKLQNPILPLFSTKPCHAEIPDFPTPTLATPPAIHTDQWRHCLFLIGPGFGLSRPPLESFISFGVRFIKNSTPKPNFSIGILFMMTSAPLCQQFPETTIHVLRDCPFAAQCWFRIGSMRNIVTASALEAELWALRDGLMLVADLHLLEIHVESDAKEMIKLLLHEPSSRHHYSNLICDCRYLMRQLRISTPPSGTIFYHRLLPPPTPHHHLPPPLTIHLSPTRHHHPLLATITTTTTTTTTTYHPPAIHTPLPFPARHHHPPLPLTTHLPPLSTTCHLPPPPPSPTTHLPPPPTTHHHHYPLATYHRHPPTNHHPPSTTHLPLPPTTRRHRHHHRHYHCPLATTHHPPPLPTHPPSPSITHPPPPATHLLPPPTTCHNHHHHHPLATTHHQPPSPTHLPSPPTTTRHPPPPPPPPPTRYHPPPSPTHPPPPPATNSLPPPPAIHYPPVTTTHHPPPPPPPLPPTRYHTPPTRHQLPNTHRHYFPPPSSAATCHHLPPLAIFHSFLYF